MQASLQDLSPFAKFATPYDVNYIHPNIYAGAGRDLPEPKGLTEVRIGFFGPMEPNPDRSLANACCMVRSSPSKSATHAAATAASPSG